MLKEANDYFNGILSGEKWDAIQDPDKEKALKESAKMIAILPLKYVPQDILDAAIFEQALCLLIMPESEKKRLALQRQGVTAIKAGNASESYKESDAANALNQFALCPNVKAMLTPYAFSTATRGGSIVRPRYPKWCC